MTDAIELLRRVSQELELKRVLDLPDGFDPEAPQLEQGRRLAPTRPHPNLSPAPEVLRLAGRDRRGHGPDQGRPGGPGRALTARPLGKTADPETRHPLPRVPDPRCISFRPGPDRPRGCSHAETG